MQSGQPGYPFYPQIMGVSGGGAVAGILYLVSGPIWVGLMLLILCLPILLWAWRKHSA